jgi:hypothetical protein
LDFGGDCASIPLEVQGVGESPLDLFTKSVMKLLKRAAVN